MESAKKMGHFVKGDLIVVVEGEGAKGTLAIKPITVV